MSRRGTIICDPRIYLLLGRRVFPPLCLPFCPSPRFRVRGNVKIIALQIFKARLLWGPSTVASGTTHRPWVPSILTLALQIEDKSWRHALHLEVLTVPLLEISSCPDAFQQSSALHIGTFFLQNFLTLSPNFKARPSVQILPSPSSNFPRRGSAASDITYSLGSRRQSSWEWSYIQMARCQQIVHERSWPFLLDVWSPSPQNLHYIPLPSRSHVFQISPTSARPNVCGAAMYRILASKVDEQPSNGGNAWKDEQRRGGSREERSTLITRPFLLHAPSIDAGHCCIQASKLDPWYVSRPASKADTGWMDDEVQQDENELRRARARWVSSTSSGTLRQTNYLFIGEEVRVSLDGCFFGRLPRALVHNVLRMPLWCVHLSLGTLQILTISS